MILDAGLYENSNHNTHQTLLRTIFFCSKIEHSAQGEKLRMWRSLKDIERHNLI